MCVVFRAEVEVIWHNPSIVDVMPMYSNNASIVRSSVEWYPFDANAVASWNCRGYRLVQLPFSIHGELRLIAPHGPWIIIVFTVSYAALCVAGSGISAETIISISSGSRGLSSASRIKRMWACGKPRFLKFYNLYKPQYLSQDIVLGKVFHQQFQFQMK